ncbi:hypothetical protein CW304_25425 [Bacillus sp. UFRGS-B20]|nr:hypothetical protein CW304_25425 [Bacillus sp. UFRGS-B20]
MRAWFLVHFSYHHNCFVDIFFYRLSLLPLFHLKVIFFLMCPIWILRITYIFHFQFYWIGLVLLVSTVFYISKLCK